ncbi:MAG: glycosyltransferase involved in cell wall biosynthesis [Lentimonas sp.]|jgi:glycosyltransferase involved in cell wall biosynthesis
MQVDYSIIIPAYNEEVELPATLAALRSATATQTLKGECIVVDNNSTDRTAEIAEKAGADKIVFEPINQISRARNAGAKVSQGRYLIFVDADTRIDSTLLNEALTLLESGNCVGGGAIVALEDPTGIIGCIGVTLWKYISIWTRTAAGSFLFCRRDAFEEIDGFDLKLYASEEVRLSHQLRKWGKLRGLSFEIIRTAARTSARKLKWYSSAIILGWIFLIPFIPIIVRFRFLCGFWYKRPDSTKSN